LPFAFSRPRGFLHGGTTATIVASMLLDRRNAILISRFGTGTPTSGQLKAAIQSKLSGSNAHTTVEHRRGFDFVTIDVSEFQGSNEVAGRQVAARRLYFVAGHAIWEVSCQYSRDLRKRVLAGCSRVATSLRRR
jgi:hypothetical protein